MTNKQSIGAGQTDDSLELELAFPDPVRLLEPYKSVDPSSPDVIVALDTNVLLLPYQTSPDDLQAIASIYKKLAESNRLFAPARAIREFAKHRERRLADMVAALNNIKSKLPSPEKRISPLLLGVEGYQAVDDAYEALMTARANYAKALDPLIATVKNWRGDDPVSTLYQTVFTRARVAEIEEDRAALDQEWKERSASRRPPGYKDASKADGGIGDFLIWKSVLSLGRTHKKDLVFVTNERKPDWFVRSNSEPLYPRMELVDEYRSASDGKSIRLCSLHELLKELEADNEVVAEVERVESANALFQASTNVFSVPMPGLTMIGFALCPVSDKGAETTIVSSAAPDGPPFSLRFKNAGTDQVQLSAPHSLRIARIRDPAQGGRVVMDNLDTSSRVIYISTRDGFAIEQADGQVLAGIVTDMNPPVAGNVHELTIEYAVYRAKGTAAFP